MIRSNASSTFLVVAAAPLLLLVGCKSKDADVPDVAVTVQASRPTQGDISEQIVADAILAPLSQAALAPRISAPIRAEFVQRGARVHRGQLLVSLESRDLQGSALESKGSLLAAKANYSATTEATVPEELKKAETDVQQTLSERNIAQRTAEERNRLFAQGALSGRDADSAAAAAVQAQAAYENAQKHLQSVRGTTGRTSRQTAQGQVESAEGRLVSAEAQVSYAELRSPIDGVVTDRPLFPGETAAAGMPVITVMDTSSLLAKLHLAQATAQRLGVNRKAELQVPGVRDPIEGAVVYISPALDPSSTTVEVWVKLPNADGHLKVGTPVHATLLGISIAQALQVPKDAILPAQDGGNAVMIVGADGKVHKRVVEVGIRTDRAVQVTSGLSPTEMVVTSGAYGLSDGAKVEIGKPGVAEDKD